MSAPKCDQCGIEDFCDWDKSKELNLCYYCRMEDKEEVEKGPMTAKEARKISESNYQTLIDDILKEIKKTAESGKYSMQIKQLGISKSTQNGIVNTLNNLGYEVYNVRKAHDDDAYFEFKW